jgi:hypothetical protein
VLKVEVEEASSFPATLLAEAAAVALLLLLLLTSNQIVRPLLFPVESILPENSFENSVSAAVAL